MSTLRDNAPRIGIHNPATGEPVGSMTMSTPGQTSAAVAAAERAQRGWATVASAERAGRLHRSAAALRERAEELAALNEAETGRPRAEALEGVLAGAATLTQYAELGPLHRGKSLQGDVTATDFMIPQPRGVIAVLTPWNDPVAVSCGLLGAALVTGNSVVYKPSERAPHTGALLGRILAETHPADVVRTVTGDGSVGAALTADPRVALVAHVGSTATGRAIREATARTGAKAVLENGGNDPLLIDRDVDPAWAAAQAAAGAFANSGQICVAVERIYVHEDIADAFVSALIAEATDRELAPLVDRRHRDHVHAHVRDALDKGATGRAGGVLADGPGAHYPATVLTGCTPDMTVMREETFGPVAPVRVVADFEQGLREATEGDYGLAATVLTGSVAHTQQAWHALPAGTVKINAVFGGAPGGAAEPRARSGQGFGFGPELLDELTATKVVHLEAPPSA